jgi:phage tail sheath protein FI
MTDPKTPGVYIEEISTLPASVAAVATAIPAFVGYTEKKVRNRQVLPDNTPVRITSMLEYIEIFGRAFSENFDVTLTEPNPDETDISISGAGSLSPYLMYYQLQMYFTNGGGPCYVVSVGTYAESPSGSDIDVTDLTAGVTALEEEDEPTLLVVPESVQLSATNRKTIYDALLAQCNKLQDRFAILDTIANPDTKTVAEDASDFRNLDVGMSNLKYGAAYYPSLKTSMNRYYTEGSVVITDDRGGSGAGPYHNRTLDIINDGDNFADGRIIINNTADLEGYVFTVDSETFEAVTTPGSGSSDHEFMIEAGPATTARNLLDAINEADNSAYTAERFSDVIVLTATAESTTPALTMTEGSTSGAASVSGGGNFTALTADKELYNSIKKMLEHQITLYPSGAVAGIYARVDRQRGVWKAPANVDVRGVREPLVPVSAEEQGGLNVDATSGKSINVIRRFAGKGNLVWGARTLAGNDNEWRYVPVRRFFIFVEESVKKATEFVVFEPNDANTWLRVKTMIENFLSKQWREGALAGASPNEAFFVKVGLGETMTPQDILEGRMNIEIGMAAVRPAEFIILKFSHKLQES